ncbi:glucosaminidase domain-containing protein [Flavobacterium sp.]|uniref:glycoside hydrolase family 73 protein n=1 Tax=Flavobacterium sp. TaxID=239 RepID=UPI00121E45C8|nr:glucosaminidase domain-containing protein [Flavobacterium sp.]RZJ71075.1 MAG: peptidoglycan hydrolase [Flavobacterium sp.]
MIPEEFIKWFRPHALKVEAATGISSTFLLAQSALESAWGKKAVGNMMFGVKDTDGVNGNEQLITTTEYSLNPRLKFPVIISVVKTLRNGKYWWKYTVKDYFRKYPSPEQSFSDHAKMLMRAPHYQKAMKVKHDPYLLAKEIAAAGYATDPNYAQVLRDMVYSIQKRLPK